MKLIFLFSIAFFIFSCARLQPRKEFMWSYFMNPDHTFTINVSGTRHINNFDSVAIAEYQQKSLEFAKQSAYAVCSEGYQINRAIPVSYESRDCSSGMLPREILEINSGEVPFPSHCSFSIYTLNISCTKSSSINKVVEPAPVVISEGEDAIRKVLLTRVPMLGDCLSKEVDRSQIDYQGIARVYFIIESDGSVKKTEVTSDDLLPKPVLDCAAAEIRKLKFPAPTGGGTVEIMQPINFYLKRRD